MLDFKIEEYRELDSTNTLALSYAREGRSGDLVIRADYQTAGRGKPGRTWQAPAGQDLLFSILIRPDMPANQAPILTQEACRTVARIIEAETGIAPEFKRPNDLLINGKKICGILTESISTGSRIEAVVIGVGLNVNAGPKDMIETATSLFAETGKKQNLTVLFKKLVTAFQEDLERLYAGIA